MAEETKKKKEKKVKKVEIKDAEIVAVESNTASTKVKKAKNKANDAWAKMSIAELKIELQKLALDIKTGREKNTSLSKQLKKHIARELTKSKITS
jgi:hypothetical protein